MRSATKQSYGRNYHVNGYLIRFTNGSETSLKLNLTAFSSSLAIRPQAYGNAPTVDSDETEQRKTALLSSKKRKLSFQIGD